MYFNCIECLIMMINSYNNECMYALTIYLIKLLKNILIAKFKS